MPVADNPDNSEPPPSGSIEKLMTYIRQGVELFKDPPIAERGYSSLRELLVQESEQVEALSDKLDFSKILEIFGVMNALHDIIRNIRNALDIALEPLKNLNLNTAVSLADMAKKRAEREGKTSSIPSTPLSEYTTQDTVNREFPEDAATTWLAALEQELTALHGDLEKLVPANDTDPLDSAKTA